MLLKVVIVWPWFESKTMSFCSTTVNVPAVNEVLSTEYTSRPGIILVL